MIKQDLIYYIIIILIILICLKIYYESDAYNLKCIIANKDGNTYCVRERAKLELAADLLAQVTGKCSVLVKHMNEKYPEKDSINRLVNNFNPKKINETLPTSNLTAYSENKGEKIAFCLNTTKNGDKLIDINTLTFVAIHELAHLMTKTIGHKQEFWENFKFLLINAKEINIYNPIDYKNNPQPYCGMNINDNPYYDL
jgi:hypothetical protein